MKLRHKILAVLFLGWFVSYLDRMVMTVAIPYIAIDFKLSPTEVGAVMSAFFLGYAFFQIPGGMLADKFGAKKVMIAGVSWWTAFTVITATMQSLNPMLFIRMLFGLGEAVFPASSWKTIANWFPMNERTTANGIMMSSNFFGPAIAPLFVVSIMSMWGWKTVFYLLFIPGLLMIYCLVKYGSDSPENHPKITPEELAEIKNGASSIESQHAEPVKLSHVLLSPVAWKCFLIWFFFDITFWGFMSWVPSYLVNERGFTMVKMGITASVPFFTGTMGLILGGWLSDKYFPSKRSLFVAVANMFAGASLYFTYHASADDILSVMTISGLIIGIAFGSIWGLPMNVMPKEIMGAASGFINMAGQTAGFIAPLLLGYLIERTGDYNLAFMVIAGSPFIAAIIALSIRRLKEI